MSKIALSEVTCCEFCPNCDYTVNPVEARGYYYCFNLEREVDKDDIDKDCPLPEYSIGKFIDIEENLLEKK